MSFISDHLNDDLAQLIYARVHRINLAPVLEEVRAFPGFPSFFERALRMGGDPVERLRRTTTRDRDRGDQDVRLVEDEWYAGSSKLLMFGRRFVMMCVDGDSDEGFLGSEAMYEGFLEGDKIKIERAYMLTRYRTLPDVECDSLQEILASDGFVDAGRYETDPGVQSGIGPLRDVVDASYHSGKSWQDLLLLQRWFYPPKAHAETDSEVERHRILYDNERVRRIIEHDEMMRLRRRARRVEETRRQGRRDEEDERFELERRMPVLADGVRDERTLLRSEADDELRRLAERALEEDREICRIHDDGLWRLRVEHDEEEKRLRQAAERARKLQEQEQEQKEKEAAERSMSRADRATTWRRG